MLNEAGHVEMIDSANQTNDTNTSEPKPPPVFITGIKQITSLINLLNDLAPGKYIVRNDTIKVQPTTRKEYSIIIKALQENKTECHTFQKQAELFIWY